MGTPNDVISPITIVNDDRGAQESAWNNYPALGILKSKGNYHAEDGGEEVRFRIKGGQYSVSDINDYEDISDGYVPHVMYDSFKLSWGQKVTQDAFSKLQVKYNRGKEAMVSWANETIPSMMESLLTQSSEGDGSIAYDFINGRASGSNLKIQGLNQVLQFGGATTAAKEATSTGTYGGLSTVTGGLSAEMDGADNRAFSGRSIHIDYPWDGTDAASTFKMAHVPYILEYAERVVTFDPANRKMCPDCVLACSNHYGTMRNYYDSKQNLYIERPDKGDNQWGLGTSIKKIWTGGMWVFWDGHVADGNSYVLNFDQIKFLYLPGNVTLSGDNFPGNKGAGRASDFTPLFDVDVDYNGDRLGMNIAIVAVCQFVIHPRYQARIADFS